MEYIMLNRDTFPVYMEEFSQLYTDCFGVNMNAEEVKWRYMDNPNKDILACIAVDKGKLVANYSTSPIRMIDNGTIIKAALSLNTMTHKDYAGRGLFVKLANSVYQYMEKNGYTMVIGFPNNISNRTFVNKLGWKDICTIPTIQIDLAIVLQKKVEEDIEIQQDDMFLLDYRNCLVKVQGIAVYKTEEYLQWRYFQNPAVKYYNFVIHKDGKVSSRIILKEFREYINIVDSYFYSQEEEKALINRAIDFGREHGKSKLTLWLKLGSWEHLLLEGYGIRLATPVTYFGANILKKEYDIEKYYEQKYWHLNLSDDNVY